MTEEIERIPIEKFTEFSKWHYGYKDNPMRLGQSFLNSFFPNVVDTKLYYCDNDLLAQKIIFEKYITCNSKSQMKRIGTLLRKDINEEV